MPGGVLRFDFMQQFYIEYPEYKGLINKWFIVEYGSPTFKWWQLTNASSPHGIMLIGYKELYREYTNEQASNNDKSKSFMNNVSIGK